MRHASSPLISFHTERIAAVECTSTQIATPQGGAAAKAAHEANINSGTAKPAIPVIPIFSTSTPIDLCGLHPECETPILTPLFYPLLATIFFNSNKGIVTARKLEA